MSENEQGQQQGQGNVIVPAIITGGVLAVLLGVYLAAAGIGTSIEEAAKAASEPARLQAAGDLAIKTAEANRIDAVTRILVRQSNTLLAYQMLIVSGVLLLLILLVVVSALAYNSMRREQQTRADFTELLRQARGIESAHLRGMAQ